MISNLPDPSRILIVKPSSLGDIITGLPLLNGLRRKYPQARISWLISNQCSNILAGELSSDDLIIFERKKLGGCWRSPGAAWALWSFKKLLKVSKFDCVIDLQGLFRSGLFSKWTKSPVIIGFKDAREGASRFYSHPIVTNSSHIVDRTVEIAHHMGIDASSKDMTLTVSPDGLAKANELMKSHHLKAKEFIVCVPPTRWVTKTYPTRHWQTVVNLLVSKTKVVLISGPDQSEQDMCNKIQLNSSSAKDNLINLAGKTSIQSMAGLLKYSSLVISGDSATKFIATAVGSKPLTLIGPTLVKKTGPINGKAIVATVPCQGCLKKRCGHNTCMQVIDPKHVTSQALAMISKELN